MTTNDDLAAVIRLACLTEDRTDADQRALINMAWRCDVTHNQLTVTALARRGTDWEPWDLTGFVMDSRVLDDDDRVIPAPKARDKRWETWAREGAMTR